MTSPDAAPPGLDERPTIDDLLSLGSASRMLGVNEATLRRWANEGRINSYLTAGGHRRFAASDLRDLLSRRGAKGTEWFTLEAGELSEREAERAGGVQAYSWYHRFDDEARSQSRRWGLRALGAIEGYLRRERSRDEVQQVLRHVGNEHGNHLGRLGLSAPEVMQGYGMFREPIWEAVEETVSRASVTKTQAIEILRDVDTLLEDFLNAFIEGHHRSTEPDRETKGAGAKR